MKALHLKNLAHGDINCGNIMVDLEPESLIPSIKIIDFGSSRLKSSEDEKIVKIPNDITITLETKYRNASQANEFFSLGEIFWYISNKNICDPALDQLLDLGIFFKNSNSQYFNEDVTLFDVFNYL